MLIDAFVNAIYLYDDKLVLTFNYKDGTRTITLDDVKEAVKNNTGSDLDCRGAPKKRGPRWGSLFFGAANWARTHLNATVRWTVATRRLNAGCSLM